MKKNLLLLYIALSFSCFSQTNFRFADSSAQWNVLTISTGGSIPPGQTWTTISEVNGDVIIKGKNYQSISSIGIRRDSLNRIYEFSSADTNEYLLFDFSKLAGDTIAQLGISGYTVSCVIDSVDSVLMGHNRKRMYVHYPTMFISDIWVDGLGSLHDMFFFPESTLPQIPENPDFELLCFFETGQLLYHHPDYDTCYVQINVGIQDISLSKIHLSPNPATTYLTIQLQQTPSSPTVFQLYDITGRMVLQKPLIAQRTCIELSGVSKGMYLYNIVSEKEKVGAGKLVVE